MKKKILTTALLAASVMTLTSCGGSGSELTIFLHQDGQIYNSDMAVYQRANEYADITLEGVLQSMIQIMIVSIIKRKGCQSCSE